MTLSLLSRSTQTIPQNRLPMIELEPLLDAIEAAATLRMHPKTLKKKARLGEIPGCHIGKYWRFRISDLNGWVVRPTPADNFHVKTSWQKRADDAGSATCKLITTVPV